jgi:hypothetical protein
MLPRDIYNDKPFIYRRTEDGYLLYSAGANGQDDGGSNKLWSILEGRSLVDLPENEQKIQSRKIPAGADDISIRMPRPAFEWPKPVSR